ncbi:Receptor-like kinase [Rhynchospora pubera]|uniref:Receptor-like kinase n=1 Tax=Rhynchospora pubera TaxID=906938 RepID=A0AAV8EN89_9POAL|nr:Receptor-like kinase [Rhynchospora pubera]
MLAVDTCLIAVYTLCIYVPKLEDLVQVYFELEMAEKEEDNLLETVGLPTRLLFRDIKEATRNFHVSIGEGGSGAIFKGMIRDGTVVAVKQIKGQPSRETEFMTELRVIASLQHIKLVRLLGYCLTRRGDRYLIYPFYENGSLDAWLFAGEEKRRLLTWRLRYQIAIDVAKALKYMHYDCLHMILHRDVKPANILLNGEFQALVSDFGISKLVGRYESSVRTKAKGTFTYMSPEVVTHGAISIKSDVYSYGMVLMELVAGRRNNQPGTYGENQQRYTYFLKIAREKLVEGKLIEVADKTLVRSGEVTEEELAIVVKVALWCIQDRPEQRPIMTDIVEMLQKRRSVDLPPRSPIQILSLFHRC